MFYSVRLRDLVEVEPCYLLNGAGFPTFDVKHGKETASSSSSPLREHASKYFHSLEDIIWHRLSEKYVGAILPLLSTHFRRAPKSNSNFQKLEDNNLKNVTVGGYVVAIATVEILDTLSNHATKASPQTGPETEGDKTRALEAVVLSDGGDDDDRVERTQIPHRGTSQASNNYLCRIYGERGGMWCRVEFDVVLINPILFRQFPTSSSGSTSNLLGKGTLDQGAHRSGSIVVEATIAHQTPQGIYLMFVDGIAFGSRFFVEGKELVPQSFWDLSREAWFCDIEQGGEKPSDVTDQNRDKNGDTPLAGPANDDAGSSLGRNEYRIGEAVLLRVLDVHVDPAVQCVPRDDDRKLSVKELLPFSENEAMWILGSFSGVGLGPRSWY